MPRDGIEPPSIACKAIVLYHSTNRAKSGLMQAHDKDETEWPFLPFRHQVQTER